MTAATLYALGRRGRLRLWREVSFYSGVALAFVVLEPPFDTLGGQVALGAHDAARRAHDGRAAARRARTVRGPACGCRFRCPRGVPSAARFAFALLPPQRRLPEAPVVALAVQSAMVAIWHVPQLYDAAARNQWIHVLEHVCFVAPALVFWGALLDAPPVRARIDDLQRVTLLRRGDGPDVDPRDRARIRPGARSTPRIRR